MPPFFFWDLRSSLLSLFWVLFQVDCLSPLHLIVLIGFRFLGTSLVAQMVKCLSIMRETWVRSLGREDPLEKEMAIHSSTIAWKIPWTEELGRLKSMGSQRVWHDWATSHSHRKLSKQNIVIQQMNNMLQSKTVTATKWWLCVSKILLIRLTGKKTKALNVS